VSEISKIDSNLKTNNDLTTFHFVRHAEVYNPKKVIYEHLPGFYISQSGKRQAHILAEFLAERKNWLEKFANFTFRLSKNLYSSPLLRAEETAVPILAKLDLELVYDQRIIEAKSAIPGQAIPRNPFKLAYLARNPFRPSWGGESYQDIKLRFLSFMNDIAQKEAGKQVICISHQSPIWIMNRYFSGKTLWHNPKTRTTVNCSVTTFVYSKLSGQVVQPVRYCAPAENNT
jgi:broad specificity phosphatase PhoE